MSMKTSAQMNITGIQMIVNLGNNPTIKATRSGKKIARFSVAAVHTDEETGRNKVKWYPVVSWGNLAELAEKHLSKGKRVKLCGNLVFRTWEDKKGNMRSEQEIVATNLILLNSGRAPMMQIAA
jgi:single-strand DNA-binding protein